MPVALGFYGFVRDLSASVVPLLDMIGEDSIELYIAVPDQVGEFDTTPITSDILKSKFNDPRISHLEIKLFKYDPTPFILETRQQSLPDYMQHCSYHPYRVISSIYSLNHLADLMTKSSATSFILTRIDMLSYISSIGTMHKSVKSDEIYGWRSYPFEHEGIAEGLLIVCGREPLISLSKFADEYPRLGEDKFGMEYILGAYLSTKHKMLTQVNFVFTLPPLSREKYSEAFRQTVSGIIAAAEKKILK